MEGLLGRGSHLAYDLQMAELDKESGNIDASLTRLSGLSNSFPGNHIIAMAYSETLLRNNGEGDAEQASKILRAQLRKYKKNPTLYELYARSSNLMGDEIRAAESMSEAHFLRGNLTEAVVQLQTLIRRNDLDYYERARMTDRLNELQLELSREDD